jgi:uncharacterized repeat protein (TIGR03803 family)
MFPYREGLVQGIDGNFYGTTENGGTDDYGIVFKMTPGGTVTVIHEFVGTDGEYPPAGLVQDGAGNLYGTTRAGGPGPSPGVVFKITPQGTFTTLTGALGGGVIYARVLLASDGNLYAVASAGNGGIGSVFAVGTDGSNPHVVYTFCQLTTCTDGKTPFGGLAEGPDHNLYGTTNLGGASNVGTIYRLTPSGTLTVLHSFDDVDDGSRPRGKLILASDGYLYGTTYTGGAGSHGTVFKIKPNGSNFSTLWAFCSDHGCAAGATPETGVTQGPDGNFYGSAAAGGQYGKGTVYRLTPSGHATSLHDFCQCNGEGANPYTDLLVANDGYLYGTTYIGGTDNDGTVFKITGPPVISTATALTDVPNPSHQGEVVAMTARVTAQSGIPAGNVVFSSDGVQIGGVALVNGIAVLNYSGLSLGTHSIVAVYQGGNGYAGSTSNTVQQMVTLPLSTTTVTSTPNPSTVGQQVTITASVGPTGPPQPTGTVSFTSNSSTISGCTNLTLSNRTAVCMTSGLLTGTDVIVAIYSGDSNYGPSQGSVVQIVNPVAMALEFVAVSPCRIVDTRKTNGTFGGPAISGGNSRNFPLTEGDNPCAIPSSAVAYSVNITVVPQGPLGYLTIWPTGEGQPSVSTLNSLDGRIKANAAIIPAGTPNGSVSVYVTNTTNVVIDINGYFRTANGSTLAFYPVAPCRVADTRNANGPLGGPSLSGTVERDFPVLDSSCQLPSSAVAYSFNFTVVPKTRAGVGYLTVWPYGQTRPVVSTLNDLTNTIVANAALVPAGTDGEIAAYATDDTDLIIDANGYFAAPGTGGLSFYPLTPCRVIDTRHNGGQPFTGELTVPVETSPCGPPPTAQGYVFNATVVPSGSLGYLTLWPDPLQKPTVSTLNALDGAITSNMAIVPNGDGKTDAFASGSTQLILDISGYFAP